MTREPTQVDPPKKDVQDADASASRRPTVDDLSEWSFPASDPPATWTWDVEARRSR
jgi:hypothetical protein